MLLTRLTICRPILYQKIPKWMKHANCTLHSRYWSSCFRSYNRPTWKSHCGSSILLILTKILGLLLSSLCNSPGQSATYLWRRCTWPPGTIWGHRDMALCSWNSRLGYGHCTRVDPSSSCPWSEARRCCSRGIRSSPSRIYWFPCDRNAQTLSWSRHRWRIWRENSPTGR